mmetsp:Transcript_23503/g.33652  ORF Transcript_23503/g.33652 Transcript_23503/m.33652 type:complete len:102 (+) Transcript_23503:2455-2760(+)
MLQSLEEELTRVLCSDAACSRLHSFRLRFSLHFAFHSMLANIMTNVHVCCVTGDIRHFKSQKACCSIAALESVFWVWASAVHHLEGQDLLLSQICYANCVA